MNRKQPPRRIDQPEAGLFKIRLVRRGPWVAARIINGMGFWSASIGGEPCGPQHPDPAYADGIERIWTSGTRIEPAEYAALLGHPPASPDKPVLLDSLPPIEFAETHGNPRMGHNEPPIDLAGALEPRALKAWIARSFERHTKRTNELIAAFVRFRTATAAGISSDAADERAVDFGNQIRAAIAATDATRIEIKAPVLAAQRAIDGAAKVLTDELLPAFAEVGRRHTAYLVAKDREARRIAAETAARAEEAAYRLAEEAANSNETVAEELFDAADAAIVEQQDAEAIINAPTPDLTRVRTALGSTSSLRDNWTYDVEDIAAVPAHFLMVNDAAIRLAIRGPRGLRKIPGLTIRNQPKAGIR